LTDSGTNQFQGGAVADITAGPTIGTAWEAAVRCHGDRPFLVCLTAAGDRREFSYRAFDEAINRTANALRARHVGEGSRVVVQVGNSPEFLTGLFGIMKIGAVAVPVGVHASPAEVLSTIAACQAEFAIVDESACGLWGPGADQTVLPGGWLAVRSPSGVGGRPPLDELSTQEVATWVPSDRITADSLAEILYTSGTTGTPKGVMVTHANLLFSGHYGQWQTSLRPDDRLLTAMPACHSNFQMAALLPVLLAGACLVLVDRYSATRFWGQVRQERATVIQLISMMVRTLLLQPPTQSDCDTKVRAAMYFMPLSDEEKERFEARFGVRLMNSYGSTESIGWAVTDPPTGERRWPSVGRAGLGYEVGIFDPAGQELPPGVDGEFWIKGVPGLSLMLGYYEDPAETRRVLRPDGWMRTSDTGRRDADGWFYFVDRADNIIKRSGENISTTEIENVLTSLPEICEAAVIAVPDELRDHAVKAFVLPVAGAHIDIAAVSAHCREQLAPHKVPQSIVVVDAFPRTPSLKIEKRLLR
jgi:crotonobetaine/carnitine-CoA ligase